MRDTFPATLRACALRLALGVYSVPAQHGELTRALVFPRGNLSRIDIVDRVARFVGVQADKIERVVLWGI